MHHIVDNLPCSVPLDKRQFPCTRFDGIDTLIIRNTGKQSIEQCGFTAAGSAHDSYKLAFFYRKRNLIQRLG